MKTQQQIDLDREARLPRWAQDELRLLRMRLAEKTEHEKREREKHPGTEVFLRQYGDLGDIPLPVDSCVLFKLDGGHVEARIDPHGRGLYLMSSSDLSDSLAVMPA